MVSQILFLTFALRVQVRTYSSIHYIHSQVRTGSLQSTTSLTHQAALIYQAAAQRFLQYLLLAILLTGGFPSYDDDLLHVRLVDEEIYARGIFIIDKQVAMSTVNSDAANPRVDRKLQDNVGQMVILYMTDVLPFLRGLDVVTEEFKTCNLFFSGPGGQWSREMYEGILKMESGKALGVELDLNDYKKVFLAIAAAHMPELFDNAGNFIGERR